MAPRGRGKNKRTDYVGLVESSYDVEAPDDKWLQQICDEAAASFDAGLGTFAFCYDLDHTERMPVTVGNNLSPELADLIQKMIRNCPRDELEVFSGQRLHCGAGTARFAQRRLSHEELFARYSAAAGIQDARYATVPIEGGYGVMLGAYTKKKATVLPGTKRMWMRSLCHVALGARLRRTFQRSSMEAEGEAILRPDGKLEHAEGPAKNARMREALREAARRIEAVRGPMRQDDPDRALELWTGLVSGRWSLVDRFESDGRRYLVAHRNPPGVVDLRRLSMRERQVARLVSHGYSAKLIAYQLGLSPSTVATQMTTLRRKLGASSLAELVQLLEVLRSQRRGSKLT